MIFRLALSGLLSAACLAGCSSPPKPTCTTGDWESMGVHPSAHIVPASVAAPGRAVPSKKVVAQTTVSDEAAQP